MAKNSLRKHIDEIHNPNNLSKKELDSFIEKFKILGSTGINSNSIFYILNLNTMQYEYINDACTSFTGVNSKEFYNEGINILPNIIIEKDFKLLSESLFPAMNNFTKKLSSEEKSKVVFELYYKMNNVATGEERQIVEFSSYSKFDNQGNPVISTGICYESIQQMSGVKGIVRINEATTQKVLFDESFSIESSELTKTEKKIAKFLTEGLSRKEIASQNNISLHTVNTHVKNIYSKLGINKVSELRDKL